RKTPATCHGVSCWRCCSRSSTAIGKRHPLRNENSNASKQRHGRSLESRASHPSAQRTAVEQRPHQETGRQQVATSEPVLHHHGREGRGNGRDNALVCFNGFLGGASSRT